jgi:hypothetical protein
MANAALWILNIAHLPTYLPVRSPTYLSDHLPTYLSDHLPTYLPDHLPTYLSDHLPTCQITYLPTCQITYLPVRSQVTYLPVRSQVSFLPVRSQVSYQSDHRSPACLSDHLSTIGKDSNARIPEFLKLCRGKRFIAVFLFNCPFWGLIFLNNVSRIILPLLCVVLCYRGSPFEPDRSGPRLSEKFLFWGLKFSSAISRIAPIFLLGIS